MSTLIHNYGLFWRRDHVFWGRPRVKGHLKGVLAKETSTQPVDFRQQTGVYVLYDDNFHLVYVGQAGAGNQHLFSRLKHHRKDALADRWTRFSWFGLKWAKENGKLAVGAARFSIKTVDLLNHIEAILISAGEPSNNKQGGRFGREVEQYLQHRDNEELGPDLESMVKELWKKAKRDSIVPLRFEQQFARVARRIRPSSWRAISKGCSVGSIRGYCSRICEGDGTRPREPQCLRE